MRMERQMKGHIEAMWLAIWVSVVNAYPKILWHPNRVTLTIIDSMIPTTPTTFTATLAPSGFPPPSSFDTLVL